MLGVKLAGIHWYYKTDSHAAELTAGYYNAGRTSDGSLRNGYLPLLRILQAYKAHLSFTCVEMRDADHYARPDACCSPEGGSSMPVLCLVPSQRTCIHSQTPCCISSCQSWRAYVEAHVEKNTGELTDATPRVVIFRGLVAAVGNPVVQCADYNHDWLSWHRCDRDCVRV